jgi:hypothetical protein
MINDPFHLEEAVSQQKESGKRMMLGVVCAVAITAIVMAGYAFMRKRHAQQQAQLIAAAATPIPDTGPKGPPLVHVMIDEPTLEKGTTVIGGSVKNISDRALTGLSVALELRKRKDGTTESTLVAVKPAQLQPQEEGQYSLRLPAQSYGSIRFVGMKADPQATLIAYSSSPGKQRLPEKIEPRTVIVRPAGRPGEFINTPDTPVRVP